MAPAESPDVLDVAAPSWPCQLVAGERRARAIGKVHGLLCFQACNRDNQLVQCALDGEVVAFEGAFAPAIIARLISSDLGHQLAGLDAEVFDFGDLSHGYDSTRRRNSWWSWWYGCAALLVENVRTATTSKAKLMARAKVVTVQ